VRCQHTSSYISIRQHTSEMRTALTIRGTQCDVSIRHHTSAYVSILPAYVSIRQHTSEMRTCMMSSTSLRTSVRRRSWFKFFTSTCRTCMLRGKKFVTKIQELDRAPVELLYFSDNFFLHSPKKKLSLKYRSSNFLHSP
jgi:hypothetical protein